MTDDGYRCMGCAGTHPKCETQQTTERLVHTLAAALRAGNYREQEDAHDAYERWA